MRSVVVIALAAGATFLGCSTAGAGPVPNLEVRVVASGPCVGDMPCDPPIRRWTVILTRGGALPVRLHLGGPGVIWVHVPPGLYTASLRSAAGGSLTRSAVVRVPRLAHATLRFVAPAA